MAKQLTERQKYILYLLQSTDENMGMDDLVRRLQVSRRTIQRDVSAMQSYLHAFNLVLQVSPQQIELVGSSADISRMLEQAGKLPTTLTLTPKDRELHVALDLLMEEAPSKLGYFGRQLHVTAASLSQSLDGVADWFSAHGLELIRRRGYGVEVHGDEEARREAIAKLVYNQVSLPDLVATFRGRDDQASANSPLAWLSKWFSADRIAQVRRVLMDELADSNPPLDEAALYGFMLHVLLTVARVEQGAMLSLPHEPQGAASQEMQSCTRIIQRLLPEARDYEGEANYLAKHLRGAKVLMTEENRILPLHITSMDLAYRMVKYLESRLELPLISDHNLITGMAQHLEPAIHRMTSGLLIRNPLLQETKRRYQTLFDAMREASNQILAPYGLQVPDEEIGYLTMHLGASFERQRAQNRWRARIVCLNGISSAELLASRIQKEFPQIEIMSLGARDEPQADACDFIVSTVPFEQHSHPVVTVSPFLTAEERVQIQALLDRLEANQSPLQQPAVVSSLTEEHSLGEVVHLSRRVQIYEVSASKLRDVMNRIADDIASAGETSNRDAVVEAILQRERLGSIVLPGKRLSVLHARTSALIRCQIGIYRLNEPIVVTGVAQTQETIDTVLVLLAPEKESLTTIRLLGKLSSALIMDADMVDVLRLASISEVRSRILQAMDQSEE